VALGGGLYVGAVNGYFAAVGDAVTVLDPAGPGPITGTFAGIPAVNGTVDSDGPTTFAVTYAGGGGNDVALTAINRPPTLDVIPDPAPTLEDPGPNTIILTGIGSGNVEPQTPLTVTAVSDNPTLVPDPVVTYTSPDAAGSLTYTPAAQRNGTATITVTVTDSGGTANGGVRSVSRTFTVTVVELNEAPTLDPISDPDPVPEDAPQSIPLTGIPAGGGATQTLTVTATSRDRTLIPNPTVTYSSPNATGTLTFTPVANRHGTATITVTVKDDGGTRLGGVDTVTRTFTVTVDSVPDAPALDTDPLAVLEPVPVRLKLAVEPAGTLVSALIAGTAADADGDPVGIAITEINPANTLNTKGAAKFGIWEFTTDGTVWNRILPTDVSPTTPLVLSADGQTRVRFKPNLWFQGLSWFRFLAWDHTDGATAGTTGNTTATPTAYSAVSERAWVAVGRTSPNVDSHGATRLAAVREDAKVSNTFAAKTLLGLARLESPPATGLGLALTGMSTATGTWQYRRARTTNFLPIDPLGPTHALLLRPTDSLRFVPAHDANGQSDLTFKTWVPDATTENYADTTTGTGFGPDSGAATIAITPVNDAPVLNPALHPDLGTGPAGRTIALTVADLLALAPGVGTDVDSTGLGVRLLPASAKVGQWQHFDVVANKWRVVTLPKVLKADVRLQFVIAAGAAPGTYGLSFKVWDGKLVSKLVGTATLTVTA
jgi:hypothetical protein